MTWLEKAWYRRDGWSRLLTWPLFPLAMLFWCLSRLRLWLFSVGLKKSYRLPVPVIVVGNISVGGNGKTPLVIRLAQWLRQQGYHPGVVSRGYGGKSELYPLSVEAHSDPAAVGDEPVLMRPHIGCPLVVDPDRPRGANYLLDKFKCNLIICDDGLQHYALQRDIEIAVLDGRRRLGNGCLLPMGPLREGRARLQKVDFVVNNGGETQSGEHLMSLMPGRLTNIKYPASSKAIGELHRSVSAVAAIGNPQRFFDLLRAKQVKLRTCISFADHHAFRPDDIPEGTVIMTEKDAVKCRAFAKDDWWYLPVSAKLSEEFKQALLSKLKTLKRERVRSR